MNNKKKIKELKERMEKLENITDKLLKWAEGDNVEEKTQKEKDRDRLMKKFDPDRWMILKIPKIRKSFPQMMMSQIFDPQPMPSPIGVDPRLKSIYGRDRGKFKKLFRK